MSVTDAQAEVRPGARFAGMWQILLYNWHFYVAAAILDLLVAAALSRLSLPIWIRIIFILLAAVTTFWAVSSLAVSHYIYDRSQLYQWTWLLPLLANPPRNWANIHAGLDQSSEPLSRLFPGSARKILDIYQPSEMSEPSIERARRRVESAAESTPANPAALPLKDEECDAIFLIFVAHELRRPAARLQFFVEVSRSLKTGGTVVLVEHLRDWKNFIAYGPGAFHFFSEREWLGVSSAAGLHVALQSQVTPFIRCFVFVK